MNTAGSVWLVTGASRGIGRAVAFAAAARGAHVGLLARAGDDLQRVLAEIGGRGAVAVADVTDPAAVDEAVAALGSALGPPDVLVNNAGIGSYGLFVDVAVNEFERIMAVNYLGTVHVTKAVLPGMLERRHGHLVNIGSIAGRIGAPFEAAYSAAKFAVSGLKRLRSNVRRSGSACRSSAPVPWRPTSSARGARSISGPSRARSNPNGLPAW